jgi:hypothetical protein
MTFLSYKLKIKTPSLRMIVYTYIYEGLKYIVFIYTAEFMALYSCLLYFRKFLFFILCNKGRNHIFRMETVRTFDSNCALSLNLFLPPHL